MKKTRLISLYSVCLAALLFLVQCSTTSRGSDRGPITPRKGRAVFDNELIKKHMQARPQVRFPMRVAVYFMPTGTADWRFTGPDKDSLLAIEKKLRAASIASQVFPLSPQVHRLTQKRNWSMPRTLRAIRLLAAKHGADTVMIIDGRSIMKRESNALALLYTTIAGVWLVPGSMREHRFVLNGSLWDVRNGYLYASAEAESESRETTPYGLIDETRIRRKDKSRAFKSLAGEFARRIANLKPTAALTSR